LQRFGSQQEKNIAASFKRSFNSRMLPTPSTSHVSFDRVYEPAEDSFLLLDTLSSESEKLFLQTRFSQANSSSSPLVVEVGTGSGVVLAFVAAHGSAIFGRPDIFSLGVDVNPFACQATNETVLTALADQSSKSVHMGAVRADLTSALPKNSVDVLIFNPPYVPTENAPSQYFESRSEKRDSFETDSQLLELSYAGGKDGMEVTTRLLGQLPDILSQKRGVAYILLCQQNQPDDVKRRIEETWGEYGWKAETVATSGKQAGWERLQIVRVWRP
jgi:release factor glutamine methyltransferase